MAEVQPYAVIATTATTVPNLDGSNSEVAAGYVLNVVMWDGVSPWSPPAGTEVKADPTGAMRIGQIVTP